MTTNRRLIAVLLAVGIGCGVDVSTGMFGADAGETGLDPAASRGDDSSGDATGPVGEITIEIEPAHATLDVVAGESLAEQSFVAWATDAAGNTTEVDGVWTFARPELGTFEGATLAATGLAGGVGTVTVQTADGFAETTLTIKVHVVHDPDGVDPAVQQAFDDADTPDPALDLLYPYDGTVFPRGLIGPTMMWSGGGPADIYRVHLSSPTYDFVGYQTVAPPSRLTLPTEPFDVWLQLTDSVTGQLDVEVQRYDGAKAYLPETAAWSVSTANLRGAIYYWEVNRGQVVRIRPGEASAETFLQTEPGDCVACHSVSRDGSSIAATRQNPTENAADPATTNAFSLYDAWAGDEKYRGMQTSGFQTLSPDGDFILWRQWDVTGAPSPMALSVADSTDVLAVLDPPGGTPTHPAWSPDGRRVAFGVRADGNAIDFTASTLWSAAVDTVTPGFSDLVEIAANDPSRPVVTYPTFSPDSSLVAFMRSTHSRTRNAQAELWLASAGAETQWLLDAANGGGALPPEHQHVSYQPTFSPVTSGGYFWLVFVSVRPYGNLRNHPDEIPIAPAMDGSLPDVPLKQLWVTAIDADPTPGQDPSHPAFWLPGQDLATNNMRGDWALSPCNGLGAPCEAGFECCEGFCLLDEATGEKTCGLPQGCAQIDDACTSSADCCDEQATCIGGYCASPIP